MRRPLLRRGKAADLIPTLEQRTTMSGEHWEIRRGLRYGSERVSMVKGLDQAKAYANRDIAANGNEGQIKLIDRDKRILYYDIYPELT